MGRVVLLGSLFISAVFAQTNPTDPSQYPPGQYPPNQYPARLPGGIPLGIPMPQINLPQRHPKADKTSSSDDRKVTLASADGVLRKMGEKDLLLETGKSRVLRFRLLAKTQFRDTKGEPIRDSLLHPGDRINVEVNPDDPETAVKVVWQRAGSDGERESASTPVAEAQIMTPSAGDFKHAHGDVAQQHADAEPGSSTSEAKPERKDDLGESAPGSTTGSANGGDQVIGDAREAAAEFNSQLPNFLVQQATTRYRSWMGPHNWQAVDVVTADVSVVNGKEDYRNILVNGHAPQGPVEQTGSWSTGEFAITLQDILSPGTNAAFTARGSDSIAGRDAWVYNLSVAHPNSHWVIVATNGNKYNPAYTGSIWIDKETRRVLRIEQHAGTLPSDFVYNKAESIVEYGFVRIEGKQYLLPVTSENSACFTGSSDCVKNELAFRNYRKFTADSDVRYDKFSSQ